MTKNQKTSEENPQNSKQPLWVRIIDWTLLTTLITLTAYYVFILKPQYNEAVIQACKTTITHNLTFPN